MRRVAGGEALLWSVAERVAEGQRLFGERWRGGDNAQEAREEPADFVAYVVFEGIRRAQRGKTSGAELGALAQEAVSIAVRLEGIRQPGGASH